MIGKRDDEEKKYVNGRVKGIRFADAFTPLNWVDIPHHLSWRSFHWYALARRGRPSAALRDATGWSVRFMGYYVTFGLQWVAWSALIHTHSPKNVRSRGSSQKRPRVKASSSSYFPSCATVLSLVCSSGLLVAQVRFSVCHQPIWQRVFNLLMSVKVILP